MEVQFKAYDIFSFIDKGERGGYFEKDIERFFVQFEMLKEEFEKSGMTERLARIAKTVTDRALKDGSNN